jgi:hypothetical protein
MSLVVAVSAVIHHQRVTTIATVSVSVTVPSLVATVRVARSRCSLEVLV